MQPVGDLIAACLRAHGATRVFGDPFGPLPVEPVAEADLAAVLAAADGRLHRVGVAWSTARTTLVVASRPGPPTPVELDDPTHVTRTLEGAVRAVAAGHESFAIRIGFDLDAPIPSLAAPRGAVSYRPFAGRILGGPGDATSTTPAAMLVGPGIARAGVGAVAGLHALAGAANIGVANTWGAKGLFRWDSPHHMGTVGIQARDLGLVFADVELVVTAGLDPRETRPPLPAHVTTVPVDPHQLGDLARFVVARPAIAPNPFLTAVAAVAQPGYADERVPHHPARVVATMRAELPPGGLVAAPADRVGRWVARTFSTTELGSVVVPADASARDAAAIVALAALDDRPALLALHADDDSDEVRALLARVGDRGPAPRPVVWDGAELPIDWGCDAALRAAAGDFVF